MRSFRQAPRFLFGILVSVCFYGIASSQSPDSSPTKSAEHGDAVAMAGRVDELLGELWAEKEIQPAEAAMPHAFMRRAWLDLTGVVPRVAEVRAFTEKLDEKATAEQQAESHRRMVDKLLKSPRHSTHLANTWQRVILPDGFAAEMAGGGQAMHQWLRGRFAQNMRYDRIVGDFLTATGGTESGPTLFYQALESKPEKLAAYTARIFLGLQLSCAQCHDHPFDDFSQEDFWEYAAFFAQVKGDRQGRGYRLSDGASGEVTLPEEDDAIAPQFPNGDDPKQNEGARRLQLSIWMSSPNNPFLAKATVNRVWSLMFGKGLVNPVDDLNPENVPVHPQLLEELSEYFVDGDYDIRELFRTLAYTKAYQASSKASSQEEGSARRAVFAQMATKALTAEQLFDSIQQSQLLASSNNSSNVASNNQRNAFVTLMENKTRDATEYAAGIQQTLHLMNDRQPTVSTIAMNVGLAAALDAPFLSDEERMETLFLSTVSRFPVADEKTLFAESFQGADSQKMRATRSDLLWALLNSAEFRFNH